MAEVLKATPSWRGRWTKRKRWEKAFVFIWENKWWVSGAESYKKSAPAGRNSKEGRFSLHSNVLVWWEWKETGAKLIIVPERRGRREKKRWYNYEGTLKNTRFLWLAWDYAHALRTVLRERPVMALQGNLQENRRWKKEQWLGTEKV